MKNESKFKTGSDPNGRRLVYILYPKNPDCIFQIFNVIEKMKDGHSRFFKVEECYRFGRGYLGPEKKLPSINDQRIRCEISHDKGVGFEVHLTGHLENHFTFGDGFSLGEQESIQCGWNGEEGGLVSEGWLFEGCHSREFDVVDAFVEIVGGFSIDIHDEATGELLNGAAIKDEIYCVDFQGLD